jgi:hypothetical protein
MPAAPTVMGMPVRSSSRSTRLLAGGTSRTSGSAARREIEDLMDTQVNLQIWVKVRKEWRDSELYMKNYGYNEKEI